MTEVNILQNTSKEQDIENRIKEMENAIAISESIEKLARNRDFKKVILEGFLIDEAARRTRESVNLALTEEHRKSAVASAQAAGHLEQFLIARTRLGMEARNRINDMRKELDLVRSGLLDEE